jgi:hypothetical protein
MIIPRVELYRQPDSIIARPPDVGGTFTHLLAEDPGWAGGLQQGPKISFECMAAFAEQSAASNWRARNASHNLIIDALEQPAGSVQRHPSARASANAVGSLTRPIA